MVSDWQETTWHHPSVLLQQEWVVEADKQAERQLKSKGKKKEKKESGKKVQGPDEEPKKEYYCSCRTVCFQLTVLQLLMVPIADFGCIFESLLGQVTCM